MPTDTRAARYLVEIGFEVGTEIGSVARDCGIGSGNETLVRILVVGLEGKCRRELTASRDF